MSFIGHQGTGAAVRVVLFPACATCGHAYPVHGCQVEACDCSHYEPSRPMEYPLSRSVGWVRRRTCELLWSLERRAEAWRLALEGSR